MPAKGLTINQHKNIKTTEYLILQTIHQVREVSLARLQRILKVKGNAIKKEHSNFSLLLPTHKTGKSKTRLNSVMKLWIDYRIISSRIKKGEIVYFLTPFGYNRAFDLIQNGISPAAKRLFCWSGKRPSRRHINFKIDFKI